MDFCVDSRISFLSGILLAVLIQPHREGDPLLCQIDIEHFDIHDIADADRLERMLDELVGDLGYVHQTVLVNPDIHEHAEIDDISDGSLQDHSRL